MQARRKHRKNATRQSLFENLEMRLMYAVHNDSFDITDLTQLRSNPSYSSITGKGVAIAVLDTGVDVANPDLTSKVVAYYNAVENAIPTTITSSSASSAADNQGHGTHTSGIAASADPNIGVAYGANLVDVKVLADSGESQLSGDPLLRGLEFVQKFYTQFNIKVVSMSIGYSTSNGGVNDNTVPAADDISREIATLQQLGITVVSAAGNSYANDPTPGESFPAVVSTISVASVWSDSGSGYDFNTYSWGTNSDSWAAQESSATADQFSATSQRSTLVNQVVAPGVNIYSDWNDTSTDNSGGDLLHNTISGTSMATPFVAGLVALMQQAAFTYGGRYITNPEEVLTLIKQTSDVITDPTIAGDTRIPISNGQATGGAAQQLPGTGATYDRVNVFKAIQAVQALFTGTISNTDLDDTTATATAVPNLNGTSDFTEAGNIGADGLNQVGVNDVDLYKVVLDETGSLSVILSQPSGGVAFTATVRLFDTNGNQINVAVGTTASGYPIITTATGSPLAAGTYYVGVSSAGNNSYNITDGNGKTGGVTTGDFTLTLSLSNPDPNGVPQGALAVDLTSPNFTFTNNYVGNEYDGTLGSDPPPTGSDTRVSVPNGDVDMFKIVAPDTGVFTAQTDATIYGSQGADSYIELLDSNLNVISTNGVSTGGTASNASLQFDVTVGQTYYVAVTTFSNAHFDVNNPYARVQSSTATQSSYKLYLEFDNGNTNGTALLATGASVGQAVSGNIASTNPAMGANGGSKYVNWYTYTANAAGLLDLTPTATSTGFSPQIEMWTLTFDTSGNVTGITEVGGITGSGQSLIDQVTAGEKIYVSVTGAGNSNFNWYSLGSGSGGDTGTYSLTSSLISASSAQAAALNDNSVDYGTPRGLTLGKLVSGNIGMDDGLIQGATDVDLYKFTAGTSGAYDLAADTSQDGSANTYLRLFDSRGNQLASNDNANGATSGSLIRANLVAGQTYYIGVSGSGNQTYNAISGAGATASATTGTYSLTVSIAGAPAITINSPPAVSTSTGQAGITFTASLDFAATSVVTVGYTTVDGTAIAGTDYTATSGTLTFQPGQTSATIVVPILLNASASSGQTTFSLSLSSPSSNAVIDGGKGTGTISNLPVTQIIFSKTKPAKYTDSSGRIVQFVLSGPGGGVVSVVGNNAVAVAATLTGTTNKSHLTIISGAKGSTVLSSLQINGSLATLNAAHVELQGDLTVTGTIGTLILAGASGSNTLSIGGNSSSGTLQLGNVSDLSVMSSEPLSSVIANSWTNLNNNDVITAPSLKLLKTTGEFGASLNLGSGGTALETAHIGTAITGGTWNINGSAGSIMAGSIALSWTAGFTGNVKTIQVNGDLGGSLTAGSIKTLSVHGNVSAGSIHLTDAGTFRSPSLGSLTVSGVFSDSELKSAGDINSIHLGAIAGSTIDAGVSVAVTGLAQAAGDFLTQAEIVSFAVTGVRGQTFAMTDSNISAAVLGKVQITRVDSANNGTQFGFASTSLAVFGETEPGRPPVRWTNRSAAVFPPLSGDFEVRRFT